MRAYPRLVGFYVLFRAAFSYLWNPVGVEDRLYRALSLRRAARALGVKEVGL